MEYILHIGLPKTGSTSLQTALSENREALERLGIVYPRTGSFSGSGYHNHKSLRLVLSGMAPKQVYLPETWVESFHAETAGSDICVVSSQGFSDHPVPKAAACLFPKGKTRVLMYVREPVAYVASMYKQFVTITTMTKNLREFSETYPLPYRDVAQQWGSVFGMENVVIRQYHRDDDDWDIVSDFANFLGLKLSDAFPNREYELNPGIAGNLLFVKRIMNFFITPEDCPVNRYGFHFDVGKEARELTDLDRNFGGKIPVDQETADLIATRSKDDLETFQRQFGLHFSPRDKPIDAGPCPDLCNLANDFARILAKARERKGEIAPILEKVAGFFVSKATLPRR